MIQLKLAFRYLVRKRVTLFAVISVLLGATAFVVVMGVMDGYVSAFHARSRMVLSDMVIRARLGTIGDADALGERLKARVSDIVECSPVIAGVAVIKIKTGDEDDFSLKWCRFIGVNPSLEYAVTGNDALADVPRDSDDWIVPGVDVLGRHPADHTTRVWLVTSHRRGPGAPIKAELHVASVVEIGLHQYDKEFVYISRTQAARFVGLDDPHGATAIRVRVRDERDVERLVPKVQAALDAIAGEGSLEVQRYQDTNTAFQALDLQRNLCRLVLGCLFAAAGFAVVAICYMIVLQKVRDIGVLRTLGLSRAGVMGTFVVYGVAVGLTGVLSGIALGVFLLDHIETFRQTLTGTLGHEAFPLDLYGFKEVPTKVDLATLAVIVATALLVSFFGSLYPAWKAARLNVVESLRYE